MTRIVEYPKCSYCESNATKLYFYSKTYSDTGKDTAESPILCCDECSYRARADLSINRGGIEGVFCKPFKEIARMSPKQIGWFCSKKCRERNDLANKPWRQLIFHIHYLNLPPKKKLEKENPIS